MDEQKCMHEWKPSGLWDGETPDGSKTGGVLYKCTKCGDKATSKEQIAQKGGTLLEGFNVMGKPIEK